MTHISTARDASDMAHGDMSSGPLSVQMKRLGDYPGRSILSHWHDAIEVIRVLDGSMEFCINERSVPLKEGDVLAVNSRRLHASHVGRDGGDCSYVCLLAGTELFSGSPWVRGLVAPVLDDERFEYILLNAADGAADLIDRLTQLSGEAPAGYEIEMLGVVHLIMARISALRREAVGAAERGAPEQPETSAQKEMVSYICAHYPQKITLAEIAEAGRVCRSRCCAIFKKYLKQSPVDFLNSYRLAVSLSLLRNTEDRIAEVADACGFVHQSYYSRMFGRKYGCTPGEYRARFRTAVQGIPESSAGLV